VLWLHKADMSNGRSFCSWELFLILVLCVRLDPGCDDMCQVCTKKASFVPTIDKAMKLTAQDYLIHRLRDRSKGMTFW
jgi:hypothetical protein